MPRDNPAEIDPQVQALVAGTNGIAYSRLVGKLNSYPIPEIRLPESQGERLLDLGCGWGRWTFAAARRGYHPIGVDHNFSSIQAAARVTRQLGLKADFVVGDIRHLPFRTDSFDVAYSYSVLQHFGDSDVKRIASEMDRTLRTNGKILVQMASAFGGRCLYHQACQLFRDTVGFEVRYRTLNKLRQIFANPTITVDCYFGLGIQEQDAELMPVWLKPVFKLSGALRRASIRIPWLVYIADSVFIESRRPPPQLPANSPSALL